MACVPLAEIERSAGLRNRVVPMLRAVICFEQHVIVICHIAGREDMRLRGFSRPLAQFRS